MSPTGLTSEFLESVPDRDGVYEVYLGGGVVKYVAFHLLDDGRWVESIHSTRHEAESTVNRLKDAESKYWKDRIGWRDYRDHANQYGDGTMRRNVIRAGGHCYVARYEGIDTGWCVARGFGGRIFRWQWLDDPTGVVHQSNSMWDQGKVPEQFQRHLPDNAVFVTTPVKGDQYTRLAGVGISAEHITVTRVSKSGSWADVKTEEGNRWREPFPFPETWMGPTRWAGPTS